MSQAESLRESLFTAQQIAASTDHQPEESKVPSQQEQIEEERKGSPTVPDVIVRNREVYTQKTIATEESKQRNAEVIAYIEAQRNLQSRDLVKSIGYDGQAVEYYLLFGQKYNAIREPEERLRVNRDIKTVLKFISGRKRQWALVFFAATQGSSSDAHDLITQSYKELEPGQQENFTTMIILYYTPSWFKSFFTCKKKRGIPSQETYSNLHVFLKERQKDVKFAQSLLGALPKENMQLYFHERNEDTEYQPNIYGEQDSQQNAFKAMNRDNQQHGAPNDNQDNNSAAAFVDEEEGKTSDIFGKQLKEFKQLPGENSTSTPLVFWLLAGYFRKVENQHHMKQEGLFRVAAPEHEVRELEIHMSQDNFYYLDTIQNCHIVSNYWKKLMREMQDPICPFDQYDSYMELAQIAPERRIYKLDVLLKKLPPLNRNTLKFIIQFMREVVVHEPDNRMTSYNIAVTVGPNIFRPLTVRPADLFNAGTYYDVVIRMMENFEILFEDAPIPNPDDFDLLAQADNLTQQQDRRQVRSNNNNNAQNIGGTMMGPDQVSRVMGRNSNMVKKQKKGTNNFEKKSMTNNSNPSDDSVLGGLGAAIQGSSIDSSNDANNNDINGSSDMYSMMAAAENSATSAQQKMYNRSANRQSKAFNILQVRGTPAGPPVIPETPDLSSILTAGPTTTNSDPFQQ